MTRAATLTGSTPHQRLAIRCALFERDFEMERVGEILRDLFERAGVERHDGVDLDTELADMSRGDAAKILRVLQADAA